MHSANRKDIQKYGCRKIKPECTVGHNKYMHGVGNADQHLGLHHFIRQTVKWPKKLSAIFVRYPFFSSCKLYPNTILSRQSTCYSSVAYFEVIIK